MSEMIKEVSIPETKELVVPLGTGIEARGASVVVARNVSYEEVHRALQSVATLEKMSQWWMGDLALQAEDILGEEYHQIEAEIERTVGVKLRTLQHYKYMAKKFPPNQRYNLPFAYHETVVRLDVKDRKEMLELADSNEMTLGEFKRQVRAEHPKKKKKNSDDFEYVLSTRSLSTDGIVDMGTIYEICSDPMNRVVTKAQLNEMGLHALPSQDQVHVIVMRPVKSAEDVEENHAF